MSAENESGFWPRIVCGCSCFLQKEKMAASRYVLHLEFNMFKYRTVRPKTFS